MATHRAGPDEIPYERPLGETRVPPVPRPLTPPPTLELDHIERVALSASVVRLRGDLVGFTPIDPGPVTEAAREYVLERDDWRCAYCGARADQVDHVIGRHHPYVQASSDVTNLVAVCGPCNREKGVLLLSDWRGETWASRWWRGWFGVLWS